MLYFSDANHLTLLFQLRLLFIFTIILIISSLHPVHWTSLFSNLFVDILFFVWTLLLWWNIRIILFVALIQLVLSEFLINLHFFISWLSIQCHINSNHIVICLLFFSDYLIKLKVIRLELFWVFLYSQCKSIKLIRVLTPFFYLRVFQEK